MHLDVRCGRVRILQGFLLPYYCVLGESDFLWEIQPQPYPWSSNCLENSSVSMLLMEVSKCWKIIEFPKISIKMKNFTRPKLQAALRKLFSKSSTPPQSFLRLWNKTFLMEIHRNTQTFAFQVHRECISLASRNGAVQMFFLTAA